VQFGIHLITWAAAAHDLALSSARAVGRAGLVHARGTQGVTGIPLRHLLHSEVPGFLHACLGGILALSPHLEDQARVSRSSLWSLRCLCIGALAGEHGVVEWMDTHLLGSVQRLMVVRLAVGARQSVAEVLGGRGA